MNVEDGKMAQKILVVLTHVLTYTRRRECNCRLAVVCASGTSIGGGWSYVLTVCSVYGYVQLGNGACCAWQHCGMGSMAWSKEHGMETVQMRDVRLLV